MDNIFYNLYEIILKESKFQSNQLNLDHIYQLFQADYLKATGKAWSKEKFLDRAQNWTFYGNDTGVIAVRLQQSGYVKLVGAAGNPKGKFIGMKELLAEHLPVWGFVSKEILPMARKMGFIVPPAFLIKLIFKFIDKKVFSGIEFTINPDGSVKFMYQDVGASNKYFIATKEYFIKFIKNVGNNIPTMVLNNIKKIVQ